MVIDSKNFVRYGGVLTDYKGFGREIYIPEDVEVIGKEAFKAMFNIERLTVGSGVRKIENNAFKGCRNLERLDIEDVGAWCSITRVNEGSAPFASSTSGGDIFVNNRLLRRLVISDMITDIGDYAFAYCRSLEEVVIEGDRTDIGAFAFLGCRGIKKISLPGLSAWFGASDIVRGQEDGDGFWELTVDGKRATEVVVPKNITHVPAHLFYGCKSIERVILHEGIRSIGAGAFGKCPNITYVEMGSLENWIGIEGGDRYSFPYSNPRADIYLGGKSVTNIDIPDGIERIGAFVFSNMSFSGTVTMPDSVNSIGKGAFMRFRGQATLDVSAAVSEIEEFTFAESDFNSVSLFEGITRIGRAAFCGCSALKKISLPDTVNAVEEDAFRDCARLSEVFIGSGVISIGACAFRGCSYLREIRLPNELKSLGVSAFGGCKSLKNVNIPQGIEFVDESIFEGCKGLAVVDIPFDELMKLKNYLMKPFGERFLSYSFYSYADRYVQGCLRENEEKCWDGFVRYVAPKLIDTVVEVPYMCRFFIESGMINLKKAETLLDTVKNAESRTVLMEMISDEYGADGNESVFGELELDESETCGKRVFGEGERGAAEIIEIVTSEDAEPSRRKKRFWGLLRKKKLSFAEEVKRDGRFNDFVISVNGDEITVVKYIGEKDAVTIPEEIGDKRVVYIGDDAFRGNVFLKKIVFPNGIIGIGKNAFRDCVSLEMAYVPENVRQVGECAFMGCLKLLELKIFSEALEVIPSGMCSNCVSLERLAFSESARTVEQYAFYGCSSLVRTDVACVTRIQEFAFAGCSSLERVSCSEFLWYISDTAFIGADRDLSIEAPRDTYAHHYAKRMRLRNTFKARRQQY